jgi:hypothetical protein
MPTWCIVHSPLWDATTPYTNRWYALNRRDDLNRSQKARGLRNMLSLQRSTRRQTEKMNDNSSRYRRGRGTIALG